MLSTLPLTPHPAAAAMYNKLGVASTWAQALARGLARQGLGLLVMYVMEWRARTAFSLNYRSKLD